MKCCTKCKIVQPIEDFHKSNRGANGLSARCKSCCKIYSTHHYLKIKSDKHIYYANNKGKWYIGNIFRNYGISIIEYNDLLIKQRFSCKICGTKGKLVVDHCHETKKIRGLLCSNCNLGLGKFKDNKAFLLNALKYLEENA